MATTVLQGGRVIDPASAFDAVADVIVDDDRVTAVRPAPPDAALHPPASRVLDVSGMIVGPGFIDLHSHVHSIAGQRLQAFDGVTTALDLEAGLAPVDLAYRNAAAEGRPLHFGFAASWADARAAVLTGRPPRADFRDTLASLGMPEWQRSSTATELDAWLGMLRDEIADGGLGIGVVLGYAPQSDPGEYLGLARLAAAAGVPTYTHVRELVEVDPATPIDGSEELLRAAAETGCHMHHCHVNSTSRRHVDRVLASVERVRAAGSPVTVEAYPYGAGATAVGAAFLAPERLAAWGVTPDRIVLLPSGERIADAARLAEVRARAPQTACIIEFLDERDPADLELLERSLLFGDSIVASDAMPVLYPDGTHDTPVWPLPPGGATHPRTAGTFTRTLRRLVRETGRWSWLEAFRRCSWLPARLLDPVAPDARRKGHLAAGADADIVVIDPDAVTDAATYLDPTQPAVGVRHLFVAGTPVIVDGQLDLTAFPGRPLRGSPH